MKRSTPALALLATAAVLGGLVQSPLASAQTLVPVDEVTDQANPQCDPLDTSMCLFPFPNDRFTVEADTPTGRAIDFSALSMPRNSAGKPVDPTEWNRNDGFSPGAMILTNVPGLDLEQTGAVSIDSLETYDDRDQPVVVIDAATGEPHPVWAELDQEPTDPARRALIVRPAVNLREGARYIVALREMRDAQGDLIEPGEAFTAYRDGTAADERAAHYEEDIFPVLEEAGIDRGSLYLAWDFTVASSENLAGRMLHIRDDAFAQLGDEDLADLKVEGEAPEFTVDRVEEVADPSEPLARIIEGTFTVPYYLNVPGSCLVADDNVRDLQQTADLPLDFDSVCTPTPGSRFFYDPTDGDELPDQTVTMRADYRCNIPRSVLADGAVHPGTPSLYGHGLLGSNGEVGAGNVRAFGKEHGFVFCATDWIGMATEDVPNVGTILLDMSNFPSLADRAQQGFLNQLFLGRLMIHPEGFVSNEAFQAEGAPLIDTEELVYDGNSQGGIMGGALTAVAPDYTRAVLGVPGMNYSTLLDRSVDWDTYSAIAYTAYSEGMTQQLIFALIQMIWDRAEANGYAQHMTDEPYPNTPAHQVMLHVAFSDHQVANVSAEVEARTIGARVLMPAIGEGRYYNDDLWGIERIPPGQANEHGNPHGNWTGSAFVLWDSGNLEPPRGNVPPRPEEGYGEDPHGHPRGTIEARLQKAVFLRDGYFIDVCGGAPCLSYKHPAYQQRVFY